MVPCMIMDSSCQSDNEFFFSVQVSLELEQRRQTKEEKTFALENAPQKENAFYKFSLMCLEHVFGLPGGKLRLRTYHML